MIVINFVYGLKLCQNIPTIQILSSVFEFQKEDSDRSIALSFYMEAMMRCEHYDAIGIVYRDASHLVFGKQDLMGE